MLKHENSGASREYKIEGRQTYFKQSSEAIEIEIAYYNKETLMSAELGEDIIHFIASFINYEYLSIHSITYTQIQIQVFILTADSEKKNCWKLL